MDKMREEFEAWYWNELYSDIDSSSKCVIFSTVSDGSYRGLECNTAWKSWKSSRAALCVELPNVEDGCIMWSSEVELSLSKAGVSYK